MREGGFYRADIRMTKRSKIFFVIYILLLSFTCCSSRPVAEVSKSAERGPEIQWRDEQPKAWPAAVSYERAEAPILNQEPLNQESLTKPNLIMNSVLAIIAGLSIAAFAILTKGKTLQLISAYQLMTMLISCGTIFLLFLNRIEFVDGLVVLGTVFLSAGLIRIVSWAATKGKSETKLMTSGQYNVSELLKLKLTKEELDFDLESQGIDPTAIDDLFIDEKGDVTFRGRLFTEKSNLSMQKSGRDGAQPDRDQSLNPPS